jgi:hypothetical protein
MSMNLGYLVSSAIFAAIFVGAVALQIRAKQFHPLVYWTTIIASTTVGTTLADFTDRSLSRLYRAPHDDRNRARWLPGVDLKVRTATAEKSMRITWPDKTSVEVGFASKGPAKSLVAVQHGKLPDKAAAARLKDYWTERFGALEEMLGSE